MALLALGFIITATSCRKEGCTDPEATNYDEKAKKDCDDCCEYPQPEPQEGEVTKSGQITSDETWTANNIYYLDGKVVVGNGATLTIEPGTIIKGKQGQESLASALIIARGGKLMAVGTADKPIVFTSELDNIGQGEKVGTNLGRTDNEKWGGVAILGRAPISAENGDTEANLEGIPVEEGFGKYGGSDPADNSGKIAYISIRHGGISIGEGNELNGLTLGGVGTGTSISNVEVYATLDDGIECFGGTVDVSNALVYFQGDDGIDLDQNYSGTISHFAVIHGDGIGTDEGLEIDGPEGSKHTNGMFTLSNGLLKSIGSADGSAADFKSKAQGTVQNVTFDYASVGGSAVKIRASFNEDCTVKPDALSYLVADNRLSFTGTKFSGVEVYTDADCPTELGNAQTQAEAAITSGTGSSVDLGSFSWTAASLRGEL